MSRTNSSFDDNFPNLLDNGSSFSGDAAQQFHLTPPLFRPHAQALELPRVFQDPPLLPTLQPYFMEHQSPQAILNMQSQIFPPSPPYTGVGSIGTDSIWSEHSIYLDGPLSDFIPNTVEQCQVLIQQLREYIQAQRGAITW